MQEHSPSHFQLRKPKISLPYKHMSVQRVVRWFVRFFALAGMLAFLFIGFVYYHGYTATKAFDPQFPHFLGRFLQNSMTNDVITALVVKYPLAEGVKPKQAIKSMKAVAKRLNVKFIDNYPLYKAIRKATKNKEAAYVEIFHFCDAKTAAALLNYNPDYSIHMPCKVALYEDMDGQAWLATLDLNLLIYGTKNLDKETKIKALKIQDNLLKIMGAGASGAL